MSSCSPLRATVSVGTWQNLAALVPGGTGAELPILLSDGTVMGLAGVGNTSSTWVRLTANSAGSYVNGTWSSLASSNQYRLFAPSVVLPDGRVLWVGGEYSGIGGTVFDTNSAEIYDPVTNVWTSVAPFPMSQFGDDPLEVLPNGNVLAGYLSGPQTFIYNPTTNVWSQTGTKLYSDPSDEETWVKLPDGSILSYDVFTTSGGKGQAQRCIPSTGQWVDASNGTLPVLTSSLYGSELGPGLLLSDGRVFLLGANGLTAFYNPTTNSWSQGPNMPTSVNGQMGADDDPATMLPNGQVLLAASPVETNGIFPSPTRIYDFNPVANTFSDITPNDATLTAINATSTEMLVLPSGQAMLVDNSGTVQIFTPAGSPQNAWRPTITNVVDNGNATYTLTGTQLNGISEGSSYGDDWANASNYPIVQLTGGGGLVYFARAYNWSNTGVATGSTSETVQFKLPSGLPAATYSVTVIANGIASIAGSTSVTVVRAVVTTTSGSDSYLPNAPATVVDAGLTLTDSNASPNLSATVSIAGGFQAGDTLNFANQNSIAGTYNSGTGVLTLTGGTVLGVRITWRRCNRLRSPAPARPREHARFHSS